MVELEFGQKSSRLVFVEKMTGNELLRTVRARRKLRAMDEKRVERRTAEMTNSREHVDGIQLAYNICQMDLKESNRYRTELDMIDLLLCYTYHFLDIRNYEPCSSKI